MGETGEVEMERESGGRVTVLLVRAGEGDGDGKGREERQRRAMMNREMRRMAMWKKGICGLERCDMVGRPFFFLCGGWFGFGWRFAILIFNIIKHRTLYPPIVPLLSSLFSPLEVR